MESGRKIIVILGLHLPLCKLSLNLAAISTCLLEPQIFLMLDWLILPMEYSLRDHGEQR
ncbi:MAG: hypothetical protein UT83_C0014G0011 [Parcubacteria group bacterium GW2011_GWA2_40_143]|nr:MAG: hypothetical protein UT83_C0014G0011 [Parcubacteria group bacterium GW2011_GWA2_40_143]